MQYVLITLAIIVCGLALRRFGYVVHLPFVVVKYGGSCLWAAMVYFLLASFRPQAKAVWIGTSAILIAIAVELFRLYHTPWLDTFRLSTAGALLLGRIFSVWNMLAYTLGILSAFLIDRRYLRR